MDAETLLRADVVALTLLLSNADVDARRCTGISASATLSHVQAMRARRSPHSSSAPALSHAMNQTPDEVNPSVVSLRRIKERA